MPPSAKVLVHFSWDTQLHHNFVISLSLKSLLGRQVRQELLWILIIFGQVWVVLLDSDFWMKFTLCTGSNSPMCFGIKHVNYFCYRDWRCQLYISSDLCKGKSRFPFKSKGFRSVVSLDSMSGCSSAARKQNLKELVVPPLKLGPDAKHGLRLEWSFRLTHSSLWNLVASVTKGTRVTSVSRCRKKMSATLTKNAFPGWASLKVGLLTTTDVDSWPLSWLWLSSSLCLRLDNSRLLQCFLFDIIGT